MILLKDNNYCPALPSTISSNLQCSSLLLYVKHWKLRHCRCLIHTHTGVKYFTFVLLSKAAHQAPQD